MVLHVFNRGVARMHSFEKPADYQAFEQVLRNALDQSPMRMLLEFLTGPPENPPPEEKSESDDCQSSQNPQEVAVS